MNTPTSQRFATVTKSILNARKQIGEQNKTAFEAFLLFRNGATGEAFAAIETMANEVDMDPRHFRDSITALVALGLVEWTGRCTPRGIKIWYIHLEMPADRQPGVLPIFNGKTPGAGFGGMPQKAKRADPGGQGGLTPEVSHNIERNKEKEQQPQTPPPTFEPVSQPEAVVVVFSPSAKDKIQPAKPSEKKEPSQPETTHPQLSKPEAIVVSRMLATLPTSDADALRAEFLARLDTGTIEKPVGYCASLVRVIKNGLFVPSASRDAAQRKEAEERKHREMEEARRVDAEERRQRAAMNDKDLEAERAKQKAFIAEALAAINGKKRATSL
ncbi:MAG: hypothetical protein HQL93_04145 [Magnetococcales bacterium]|nr:hypothetical protein [Magnetococcales bacterium]